MIRDLEQRHHRSTAEAHEQPAAAIGAKQVAAENDAPDGECHGSDKHAPETDTRGRHEIIEAGRERPGGAPRGTGSERHEIPDDARCVFGFSHGAILPAVSSARNTVTAWPP